MQLPARDRHPDLLDCARAFYIGKCEGRPGLDHHIRRDLPAQSEIAGLARRRAINRHTALAFLAREILRTYRAGQRIGQVRQIAEMEA
ncbi:hypothetical protein ACNJX9_34865 [Bradyrhizobium sp. DASA03076]|uniref:hypothetical protein n=1 Tax=Bradyrhizobium sp. BLXBL-03 TaxID=3395916 RepID=UPI003F7197AC